MRTIISLIISQKRKIAGWLAIAFLALFPGVIAAQDFKADIEKMQQTYLSAEKLQTELEISIYNDVSSAKPYMIKRSILKKNGDSYFSSTDGITVLLNGKYVLLVSDQDKQIIYSKRDEKAEKEMMSDMTGKDLGKLLANNDSIVFKGMEGNRKHYTVYSRAQLIQSADIYLDKDNCRIREVIYYYNQDKLTGAAKVKVSYVKFDVSPRFTDQEFSEKRFVNTSGKKATPSAQYPGYSVVYYDPGKR